MSANDPATRTVSVIGEGRAPIAPDIATVQLGVETTDAALTAAQADNAAWSAALRARLRALGIAPRDIQTVGYQVGRDHGPEGPRGYRVANLVRVTIRALDAVGALLDAAIEAGANQIHQIGFGSSDPAEAQHRAREAAVDDARTRAAHYAALTGTQLGPVLAIAEGGATPPAFAAASTMRAMRMPTPIEPGEETIVATIQITYALLPGETATVG